VTPGLFFGPHPYSLFALTPGLPFGPHPCKPFALVVSPRLGLLQVKPHINIMLGEDEYQVDYIKVWLKRSLSLKSKEHEPPTIALSVMTLVFSFTGIGTCV